VERVETDLERRLYLGVVARMMLSGPVLMLAFVLPKVAPLDWTAVGVAIGLFAVLAGFGVVALRRPSVRSNPAFVMASIVVATAAVGMGIVGSQDPGSTSPFALVAAMSFQLNTRRPLGFAVFAWVLGTGVFAAAQSTLGVPGAHVLTHTAIFAGLTGVIMATIRFLVEETHAGRRDAESLTALAQLVSSARDLDEAMEGGRPMIVELTGCSKVRHLRADATVGPSERPSHLVELGMGASGPASLALWEVQRPSFVRAVADLLVQVCERERILAELVHRSHTDPVTGVANRRGLDEMIGRGPGDRARTVVMLDLDHFKAFNDRHGHLAGDELLARFARVLEQHVRPGDHVSRYGGEEFCLVLDAGLDAAAAVVERIAEAWRSEESSVTFSAGLAAEHEHASDPTADALARADRALYRAKDAGRNRVVVDR
jgi:diguanylate cyclase (GGDEF)-like protein